MTTVALASVPALVVNDTGTPVNRLPDASVTAARMVTVAPVGGTAAGFALMVTAARRRAADLDHDGGLGSRGPAIGPDLGGAGLRAGSERHDRLTVAGDSLRGLERPQCRGERDQRAVVRSSPALLDDRRDALRRAVDGELNRTGFVGGLFP